MKLCPTLLSQIVTVSNCPALSLFLSQILNEGVLLETISVGETLNMYRLFCSIIKKET